MERFLKTHRKKIIFGILALFFVVSALNAKNDSATFDEVAHIPAAYSYLTQHDNRLNPEHPPLIKDLSAIPLTFMSLNFDTSQKFWTGELPNKWDEGQWAAGRHLLYQAGNNENTITFWSRIPIIILSIILGLFLYKWGKETGGILAGLFALMLFAFDPNILGHNHFVTTDLGVAAFLTFAFYFFLKFLKYPTWKNATVGGIFLGLLLVSKFSSVVALPVFVGVLFVYSLAKEARNWKERLTNVAGYILKSIAAFAVATSVIWVVYLANTYEMPKETFAQTVEFFFPANDTNIKTQFTNKTLLALNESDLTRPLGSYIFGPAWMFKRVSGGNGAYFLGEVGNGFTWYFPVVFTLKETIPFLILIVIALGYTLKQIFHTTAFTKFDFKKIKRKFVEFLRNSVTEYTLFGFIVLYAYLSITGGLNIGFRHLFPILPFAYILVTKKTFELLRSTHIKTRHIFTGIILFLSLWQVVTTVKAYPSYTSYFNEAAGGPKNGYNYVTDSNADWGQDLKRLNIYLNNHPEIKKIRVDYFGGGDIYRTIGQYRSILWWDSKRPIENGYYAISANFLMGSIHNDTKTVSDSYKWIKENNIKQIDQVGTSILIYKIDNANLLKQ